MFDMDTLQISDTMYTRSSYLSQHILQGNFKKIILTFAELLPNFPIQSAFVPCIPSFLEFVVEFRVPSLDAVGSTKNRGMGRGGLEY